MELSDNIFPVKNILFLKVSTFTISTVVLKWRPWERVRWKRPCQLT